MGPGSNAIAGLLQIRLAQRNIAQQPQNCSLFKIPAAAGDQFSLF